MSHVSAALLVATSSSPKVFDPWVYQTYMVLSLMALLMGGVIVRANPRRGLNQCAGALVIAVAAWLFFSAMIFASPHTTAFYIRAAVSMYGVEVPLLFMLLGSLRRRDFRILRLARQSIWVWVLGVLFIGMAVSPWAIPYHSTSENPVVGPLWFPLGVIQFVGGVYMFISAIRHALSLQGAPRFVAQMIVGGGSLAMVYFGVLQMARTIWVIGPVPLQSAGVATTLVGILTYAVLTKRFSRARAVFFSWAAWSGSMAVALGVHVLITAICEHGGLPFLLQELVGLSSALAIWAMLLSWRRRVLAARVVTSAANLKRRLAQKLGEVKGALDLDAAVSELVDWSGAESGMGLVRERAQWRCGEVRLALDDALIRYLEKHRWVTAEGLSRSWQSDDTRAIGVSLDRIGGALALMTQPGALGPGVIVVLSEKVDRSLYSFVEIDALLMIADSLGALVVSTDAGRKAFATGRMQALELMGASIGHDFKQHLTAVKLIAQRLLCSPGDQDLVERSVPVLVSEADKLGEFARRLMRLGSQEGEISECFDVEQLVREVMTFVKPKARDARVNVVLKLAPNLPELRGDRYRLQRALINLCINGIEAMAETDVGQPRELIVDVSCRADEWLLVVADSGPGLPEQIKGRVFDPFVSDGKTGGDGLGLYLVWDTVTRARGSVWHEPNEPRGTRFVITLPS